MFEGARIQAFTFSSQDHGRLSDKHISKHSRWNSLKITVGCLTSTYPKHSRWNSLKITVGCLTSTYPSIHVETPSRSRSVVWQAHIQALTFPLTKTLSRSRSVVDCAHIRAFATKTLKITVGCPLCTYPSIRTRRQTKYQPKVHLKTSSRHGLWLRRWRLMSSIPLLFRSCSMKTSLANDLTVVRLETKEGPFYYRNISGEEFFYYSFKLIPETRRRGKLQSLQFYINAKTIGL